jgi:hypothetical protein
MNQGFVEMLAFAIQDNIYKSDQFPYDEKTPKNKRRKPHMRDTVVGAFERISPTMVAFEIGNQQAEKLTPHYHILEDTKLIRNPYRGSKVSRGSQANVRNKAKRDYSVGDVQNDSSGYVTKEYRKTFGIGKRSYWNAQRQLVNNNFNARNEKRAYRYNIHYAYIERILEDRLPIIAQSLGLKIVNAKGQSVRERVTTEQISDLQDLFRLSPLGE